MGKASTATIEPKQDTASRRQHIEAILRELASTGRFPSADEMFELRAAGYGDPDLLRREIANRQRVLSLQRQAGTKLERLAMQRQVTSTAELLAEKSPEIQAKIDELSKELRRLETDARLSEKRLSEMNQASELLKKFLPADIQADFARRRQAMEQEFFVPLQQTQARLRECEYLLTQPEGGDSNALQHWMENWRRVDPTCVDTVDRGRYSELRLNHNANAIQLSLRSEVEQLTERLTEQQAAFDKASQTLDSEMEAYCDARDI